MIRYKLASLGILALAASVSGCANSLVAFGSNDVEDTPADFDMSFEDVFVVSATGDVIHGWHITHPQAKATMMFNCGQNHVAFQLPRIRVFNGMGLNVLAYNYRGWGLSGDEHDVDASTDDATAMLDWLIDQPYEVRGNIVVYGLSFGGWVASALSERRSDHISSLIFEGVGSPPWVFSNTWPIEAGAVGFVLGLLADVLIVWDLPPELDPRGVVSSLEIPKLIVGSEDDINVSWSEVTEFFEIAAEPKELYKSVGGHIRYFLDDPGYADVVEEFILRHTVPESLRP